MTKDTSSGLEVSRNSRYLATGNMSDVSIINTNTLNIRNLKGHTDYVTAVAFAQYSTRLATTSWDQTIRIWDVEKGVQTQQLQIPEGYSKAICFGHGDTYILAGVDSGKIYKFNLATGQHVVLYGHEYEVSNLSSYRDIMVSTCKDGTLGIWSLRNCKAMTIFQAHTAPILGLEIIRGRVLHCLTGAQDKTMRMWNILTQEELLPSSGHTDDVTCLAISEDSAYLASGSSDKTLRLWEIATGKEWLKIASEMEISAVAFGLKSSVIASAEYNVISLYERSSGKLLKQLIGHSDKIRWLQFESGGKLLYSVSWDGIIATWDINEGKMISQIVTGDSIECASLNEAKGQIAIGYWSGKLETWDLKSGKKVLSFEGHKLATFSVQFTSNSLVSITEEGYIAQWDIDKGTKIQGFAIPNVKKMVVLCNDDTIATITEFAIELWSLKEAKRINTLHQPNQPKILLPLCSEKIIFVGNASGTIFQYQEK